jgi:hypothetical protein
MDGQELFLSQHARAHAAALTGTDVSNQDLILRDVTYAQMRMRPQPGLNSLAWLIWHMTRAEDIGIDVIVAERPQVFDEGSWAEQLRVSRRDLGSAMSDSEVDHFNEQIEVEALLAYRAAVGRRTLEVVANLQPEVLDEVISRDLVQRAREAGAFGPGAEWVPRRWEGKPKAFTLTHTVLAHSYLHWGEAGIVRGLLGFPNL